MVSRDGETAGMECRGYYAAQRGGYAVSNLNGNWDHWYRTTVCPLFNCVMGFLALFLLVIAIGAWALWPETDQGKVRTAKRETVCKDLEGKMFMNNGQEICIFLTGAP